MSNVGKGFGVGIGFVFGIIAAVIILPIVFIAGCGGLAALLALSHPTIDSPVVPSSISSANSIDQSASVVPTPDNQTAEILTFSTNTILSMMDGVYSADFSGRVLSWGYHQWQAMGSVTFTGPDGNPIHWDWAVYSHDEGGKLFKDYARVGTIESGRIPQPIDSPQEAARKQKLRDQELDFEAAAAKAKAVEQASNDAARLLKWQQDEAEDGNAAQQYNLGVRYSTGDGVAKDPRAARAWFAKAAAQGDQDAIAALTNSPPN